jgi:hypothetical protein
MVISPIVIFSVIGFFILCSICAWKAVGNYSYLFAPRGKGYSHNSGFSVSDSLKHLDEAMVVFKQLMNRGNTSDQG